MVENSGKTFSEEMEDKDEIDWTHVDVSNQYEKRTEIVSD